MAYYLYQPGLMDTSRIYFGTDTRAFALLIGAALAICLPSKMFEGKVANNKYRRISLDVVGGISFVILFWLIWQTNQYEAFLYHGGMVLQCIASAVVVAAAIHPSTWITRILGCRLFQWLGVRSYGIYIWHYPVLVLFFPLSDGENSISHILIQIGITLLLLTTGTSMGIHESQSLFYENFVGRNEKFWQHNYGRLQHFSPAQFGDVALADFLRAINMVEPSFIHIEADELTYPLHIMIRYEIERYP